MLGIINTVAAAPVAYTPGLLDGKTHDYSLGSGDTSTTTNPLLGGGGAEPGVLKDATINNFKGGSI